MEADDSKGFLDKLFSTFGSFGGKKIIKFTRKCNYCKVQIARWANKHEKDVACDECVPRGCSCQLVLKNKNKNSKVFKIENYDYKKGKDGKVLPCENWTRLK